MNGKARRINRLESLFDTTKGDAAAKFQRQRDFYKWAVNFPEFRKLVLDVVDTMDDLGMYVRDTPLALGDAFDLMREKGHGAEADRLESALNAYAERFEHEHPVPMSGPEN